MPLAGSDAASDLSGASSLGMNTNVLVVVAIVGGLLLLGCVVFIGVKIRRKVAESKRTRNAVYLSGGSAGGRAHAHLSNGRACVHSYSEQPAPLKAELSAVELADVSCMPMSTIHAEPSAQADQAADAELSPQRTPTIFEKPPSNVGDYTFEASPAFGSHAFDASAFDAAPLFADDFANNPFLPLQPQSTLHSTTDKPFLQSDPSALHFPTSSTHPPATPTIAYHERMARARMAHATGAGLIGASTGAGMPPANPPADADYEVPISSRDKFRSRGAAPLLATEALADNPFLPTHHHQQSLTGHNPFVDSPSSVSASPQGQAAQSPFSPPTTAAGAALPMLSEKPPDDSHASGMYAGMRI